MAYIFLAAPFSAKLIPDGGLDDFYKSELVRVLSSLRGLGHSVFSAHERESWGLSLDTPAYALGDDLSKIRECELLVALMSSPPSPGVQMEIGAAVALNKRVLILSREGDDIPYLIPGVPSVADGLVSRYKSIDEIPGLVIEFLHARHLGER